MSTPSRHPIFLQKINEKSFQTRSKINQKHHKSMTNRSWERHEAQDRLFCLFGGSWVRFVGHKRPTWPQLGSQDGAQIAQTSMPKLMQKIDASWMCILAIFSDFGSQLGSQMEASWASKTHCCQVYLKKPNTQTIFSFPIEF